MSEFVGARGALPGTRDIKISKTWSLPSRASQPRRERLREMGTTGRRGEGLDERGSCTGNI